MEKEPLPQYIGEELELFSAATNWKNYFSSRLSPYISGTVLEAGAGIGSNTSLLCKKGLESWTCLEPDIRFVEHMNQRFSEGRLPVSWKVVHGTTATLDSNLRFDSILYIDVLEHIEDDTQEIRLATDLLADNGHLIVLSPAHQFLMSPFDEAVGHFRRYTIRSLETVMSSSGLQKCKIQHLDSVGAIASIANKILLRQSKPTKSQIKFWDGTLIPLSIWLDRITHQLFGKSIISVFQKA